MLTQRQNQLLQFIAAYSREWGSSPSYSEMCGHMGLASKSGVARVLDRLEERGFIYRMPYRARAIEVIKPPKVRTPMLTPEQYEFYKEAREMMASGVSITFSEKGSCIFPKYAAMMHAENKKKTEGETQ